MNEPILHPNEKDPENRIAKKSLNEMKVTTYTNNVYIYFWWFNHRNFIIKHVLLRVILCWVTSIFLGYM